jgi:dienelactone hydrolase
MIRTIAWLVLCTASACSVSSGPGGTDPSSPESPPSAPGPSEPTPTAPRPGTTTTPTPGTPANCTGFVVTGDPKSATGATWTYAASYEGVTYKLKGILMAPAGTGPFPAVVISHGKGGTPNGYSAKVAKEMVGFGLVAIGTQYSHAPTDDGLPKGADGASLENVQRGHRTRALLGCLGYVDEQRVAAHGHSMGAFLTAELVGSYPKDFRVASHSAGGTNDGGAAATRPATAAKITTPYQMHHGTLDTVVLIQYDRTLASVLTAAGTQNELLEYDGFDHDDIPFDAKMLASVHTWYTAHGMF